MDSDRLIHDLIVEKLRHRYSREYRDVTVRGEGDPDIELSAHGLTVAAVEVETEKSITSEKAEKWKEMKAGGTKLVLVVPRNAKVRVTELLWQKGLAGSVSVGTYEIVISMP